MPQYFEFTVTLKDAKPKVWRKFQLNPTATFLDLHEAIQDACGWYDSHLFSFFAGDAWTSKAIAQDARIDDDMINEGIPTAQSVELKDYFDKVNTCEYVYDFGDNWCCEIVCKFVTSDDQFERRLIDGKKAFPPEDCGGLPGFEDLLEKFKGKRVERNLEEVLEESDWHPDHFYIKEEKELFDR